MTDQQPCILCRKPKNWSPDRAWNPNTAAPGWHACHHCANRLAGQLGDLADRYATLQEADELIPTSSGERGSPGFGPRSPAVDALLVHSDVRTKWTSEMGYGALATVESWARMIREETGAGVPAGRATMARELRTIRWNWDYLLSSAWLDEFAGEIDAALFSLKRAGRLTERVMRVGPCPGLRDTGDVCGVTLRVLANDEEIRCRTCGYAWQRSMWYLLGDPWTDYAALSGELEVSVATLRWWCHEDEWETRPSPTSKKRVLVSRADAMASYGRRRKAAA